MTSTRQQLGYWRNLLTAASYLLAALIGARYDLSMSAQCGAWAESTRRWSLIRAWVIGGVIDWYFLRYEDQPDHCRQAWFRWQRIQNIITDATR